MKLYDKIYVPHDPKLHGVFMDDNYRVTHEGFAGPTGTVEVVPQRDVVVLTVEELRVMCSLAIETKEMPPLKLTFEAYLQSKGIQL